MKEQILKLREEGKTYSEIKELLGCSKSTISYYCGHEQKEKTKNRVRKRRLNTLVSKTDRFIHRKKQKNIDESLRKFQKRSKSSQVNKDIDMTFTWKDVLEKYTENTVCYLSGEKINLYENNYNLDHIIPYSRGGKNTIENLGITHKIANTMKSDLTPDELIEWCKKILEYNGFSVNKI